MGIDMKTMDMRYCITNGELKGSYDSRISIQVKRELWITENQNGMNTVGKLRGKNVTHKQQCKPYIVVEASIHKLFIGHNIYGGTSDFQGSCEYLIHVIEGILGAVLPDSMIWMVKRIDYAYVFNLGSMEACNEFFYLMKNSSYPRRGTPTFYGLHGLDLAASTTVVKAYLKGVEFRKHDFKRLSQAGIFTEDQLFEMLMLASGILRFEVGIKSKKLKYDFEKGQINPKGIFVKRYGHEPFVKDISTKYLDDLYDIEVNRLMKDGRSESKLIRDSMEVETRLNELYGSSLANVLFSAWLKITNFGIEFYRKGVPDRTYYRNKKLLIESGVSFNLAKGKNLVEITGKTKSLIPDDFQPIATDDRRLIGQDEFINLALDKMYIEKEQKKNIHHMGMSKSS